MSAGVGAYVFPASLNGTADQQAASDKTIAVVIPLYNERDNVEKLFLRFRDLVRQSAALKWSLILVDDGSVDGTTDCLIRVFSQRVEGLECRVLELSRNFGKEAALAIGFEVSDADFVATVDADLQDPPELIPQMLATLLTARADVVCGKRIEREGETPLRRAFAHLYYRIAQHLTNAAPDVDVGDFRVMTRQVAKVLGRFHERSRFMKSIYATAGFRRIAFPYKRQGRAGGKPKLSMMRLVDLAVDGITGLSIKPLRIGTYLSILVFFTAFCYSIFLTMRAIIWGRDVPGYASLMVAILVMNGLQLALLGLLGEYLGRVLIESKQRPIAIVRRDVVISRESV